MLSMCTRAWCSCEKKKKSVVITGTLLSGVGSGVGTATGSGVGTATGSGVGAVSVSGGGAVSVSGGAAVAAGALGTRGAPGE